MRARVCVTERAAHLGLSLLVLWPRCCAMTRFPGCLVLVLVLVTVHASFAQDNDTINVLYPQAYLTVARGSSVTLSCEADYNFARCDVVHVVWLQKDQQGKNLDLELTDPRKYLTTVSETASAGDMRRRQVVTEIYNVTEKDAGQYQCKAQCGEGDSAMGHYIYITVTD